MATVRIGPGEDGQTVRLQVHDRLLIALPENPTTGVRWQIDSALGPLRQVRDGYGGSTGDGIGAGNTRELELEATAAGSVELRLNRLQAWEGSASADARYHVTVQVD